MHGHAQNSSSIRFAVIGDFGKAGQPEADVASMVNNLNPDFIITTGDNNYDVGAATTIDENIGQYYSRFISPYVGSYGSGDTINRFFPCLGNHDWATTGAVPYLNYFSLPGNERYYDFVRGPVHFFAIDSDPNEPDGIDSSSVQAQWLKTALAGSTAIWKIVYMHHPPYSSSSVHGSTTTMQWPFKRWGASAVLAGHDHTYERLLKDSLIYIVNGLGGRSIYSFGTAIPESHVRFNDDYGAMIVVANSDSITFLFITRNYHIADRHTLHNLYSSSEPLPEKFSLKQNYPNPFNQGTTIRFDLPESGHVKISLFNELGQKVRILADDSYNVGENHVLVDMKGFSSGIYFYRMETKKYSKTKKMIYVK